MSQEMRESLLSNYKKKNLQVSACMYAVISVLWKWMYLPKKADVDLNVFEKITGICFEKDIVWKEIK